MTLQVGVKIEDPQVGIFNGQEVEIWPRIVWSPKWALTFLDVKKKLTGNCEISQKSTLVVKGANIHINDLSLDGALIVNAIDQAEVCTTGLCFFFNVHFGVRYFRDNMN
jgi:UDP-sugar pyrophosphorylase